MASRTWVEKVRQCYPIWYCATGFSQRKKPNTPLGITWQKKIFYTGQSPLLGASLSVSTVAFAPT